MPFFQIYLLGLFAVVTYMTAIWLVSVRIRDASIVDFCWGVGFILVAAVYALLSNGDPLRKGLILTLVTIWGARLSIHIFLRNRGHGEDFRYQVFRRAAGDKFWWVSFFQVFLLQGVILWIVSAPLLAAQHSVQPLAFTIFDMLGVVVWAVGFYFEAVGDWQLWRFKADPANAGKLLTTGLWAYTRHPNYFGDAAVWWGFFLIAVSVPNGILTFFGPLLMTFLLMRVSGVALLERSMRKRKPDYEAYMRRTSAFFPRPPRREN